jgi:prevent-host-death family protein
MSATRLPEEASMTVNIHEAKTHLSRLVDEAAQGREIVIARAGKPVAKLVPLSGAARRKTFGLLKGRIKAAKDFDAPLPPDVLAEFEGGEP